MMPVTALHRSAPVRVALAARVARLIPLAAFVAVSGCFATRNDVRTVQTDIASMRTELLKNDAEQRDGLTRAMRTIQIANDSITAMSARMYSIQGNISGGLRTVNDQLLSIQQLLKQSAATLERYRLENEKLSNQAAVSMQTPPSSAVTNGVDTAAAARTPLQPAVGPNELYATGMANLNRGSISTARNTFQELLDRYPNSDKAPAASIGIAQTYVRDNNIPAAFTQYGAVVTKYPDAPEAANALYKRAQILRDQGKNAEARLLLLQITSKKLFETTIEFDLAKDMLKTITP